MDPLYREIDPMDKEVPQIAVNDTQLGGTYLNSPVDFCFQQAKYKGQSVFAVQVPIKKYIVK